MNQERDNALSLIIETSIDLKSVIQTIDEKAKTSARQTTFRANKGNQGLNDQIHDLELRINKMVHISDCKDHNVVEIKNHLIDLYQRVGVNLLKKHVTFQDKL